MLTAPVEIGRALGRGHTAVSRLSLLAGPLDTSIVRTWDLDERVVLSGSVTRERAREVRGTSGLGLLDPTGELEALFVPGALYRLERGVMVGGTTYYETLATDVVDRPERDDIAGQLSLSGNDRLSLAARAFGSVEAGEVGERVGDVIRRWLSPAVGSTLWRVDDGSRALGSVVAVLEDEDRLARAAQLAADFALELYADRAGVIVVQPIPDFTTAPSVATYDPGPTSTMLSRSRTTIARPANMAVVIGEPADGPVVRGEARITDTSHPWHEDSIGLQVASVRRSSDITEQDVANAAAWADLTEATQRADVVDLSLVPDFRLEEGDVVTAAGVRYRIDSILWPATTGTMSITASRTRSLV